MAIIIPPEIKNFHKVFEPLCYMHDAADVFDTFLEWLIAGWNADDTLKWESGKRYKEKERRQFYTLFEELVKVLNVKIRKDGQWYDLFGTYYESFVAGKSRRDSRGQFFTPSHICDFKAKIVGAEDKETGLRVSDPCSGSGRLLLAFHAHAPGNFLYASDIDRTCCMMTVCNFLMHGGVGEVVWHNSLLPNSWNYGWRVNANLNNPFHKYYGIPHVETLQQENSLVFKHWQQKIAEAEIEKPKLPTQLTLFEI